MNRSQNGKPISILFLSMFVWLFVIAASSHAQLQSPPRKSTPKPAAPASQSKEDPLAPLLRQAADSIDKMDFAAAVDPLQKYIAERPDDSYAHFQLGYAYAGLKRAEGAKTEFSRAVALDPKLAAGYLNLGLVLMDGDPAAAAEAFRHAAELQPSESRPRFLEGLSLEHAGNLSEAIGSYRGALALSPNEYEIHFALARALLQSKDAAGAEAEFRSALALRADSAPARLGLANALQDQTKYEAASDAFAEYLKLKPEDRGAHFDRAYALLNLDRLDDALAELDLADKGASPAPESLKMRGEIYMQQKKWKEAAETLTQAVKLSPSDSETAYWLGHVDFELRDYPAAIGLLSQVYKQNPQSADALRELASALFLHEDYAAALGAMDRLDKMEPPKPGSWFVRAICYDKLSRKAEAVDAYQKFLDQDNGQHDNQDIEAQHRMVALQKELAKSGKTGKN
ncbi:MAG: tetratricopeptide repeat protein [Acidobacteriia bacterium]|nr:tetratricopeptide repeat protein [Terriglobia bacterium]